MKRVARQGRKRGWRDLAEERDLGEELLGHVGLGEFANVSCIALSMSAELRRGTWRTRI